MAKPTIGILMPGDMGHGCGKAFVNHDFKVISCLNDRSARTKKLAKSAGIEDVETIHNVVKSADIILSILPPEKALEQSRIVNDVILELKKYIITHHFGTD